MQTHGYARYPMAVQISSTVTLLLEAGKPHACMMHFTRQKILARDVSYFTPGSGGVSSSLTLFEIDGQYGVPSDMSGLDMSGPILKQSPALHTEFILNHWW